MTEELTRTLTFAEIAVDVPVGRDRTFTYAIPNSLRIVPGQMVTVPFGARSMSGVVMKFGERSQVSNTREIIDAITTIPPLTQIQLNLARWISRYYYCSLFSAVSLMLPPGVRHRVKTYFEVGPSLSAAMGDISDLKLRIIDYIRRNSKVDKKKLIAQFGENALPAARSLLRANLLSFVKVNPDLKTGRKTVKLVRISSYMAEGVPKAIKEMLPKAPRRSALLTRLFEDESSLKISVARRDFGHSAVKWLLEQGWLELYEVVVDRDPLAGVTFDPQDRVKLTSDQIAAASEIKAALSVIPHASKNFLIQGVTGSGKTEVYLEVVKYCLETGRGVIVLVPEIALTGQTVERFASRFPGHVAVFHSGLSMGERFDQWQKIRKGQYPVVIGSRSAIFAPVPDLGMIIIDEEHEWTYKQHDSNPRYHGKYVALKLASLGKAVLVLGSATPDVESYFYSQTNNTQLLNLPDRVTKSSNVLGKEESIPAPLAEVKVVDMRRELRQGNRSIFSRDLSSGILACLESNLQVILFLNRRGSAASIQCRRCGFVVKCRQCDIPMSYHHDIRCVLCHHCGDRRLPPSQCAGCQTFQLTRFGIGTQAVISELSDQFPGARALRWDSDSASKPGQHQELLNRFRTKKADILVGTQMIAKGLHFPSVTLVGVVLADIGLSVPDYRVGERAFQLLCQVSGRSGRGETKGRAIIQTFQPEHYAIRAAARQNYAYFYREEIDNRRRFRNPPFRRLIRLQYAHRDQAICEGEAIQLADRMRDYRDIRGHRDVEILGPMPSYPTRLKGRYKWQLLIRSKAPRLVLDKVNIPHGWVVDVDPVGPG